MLLFAWDATFFWQYFNCWARKFVLLRGEIQCPARNPISLPLTSLEVDKGNSSRTLKSNLLIHSNKSRKPRFQYILVCSLLCIISHYHNDMQMAGHCTYITAVPGEPLMAGHCTYITAVPGEPLMAGHCTYITAVPGEPLMTWHCTYITAVPGEPLMAGHCTYNTAVPWEPLMAGHCTYIIALPSVVHQWHA